MIWRLLAWLRLLLLDLLVQDEPDLCERMRRVRAISNDDIRGIGV